MDEKKVQEMAAKLETLTNDPAFMEKIGKMESYEEIAAALTDEGVEVTADEVEQYLAMAKVSDSNGELSEEALDSVSGGWVKTFFAITGKWWVNIGIAIGNRISGHNHPYF